MPDVTYSVVDPLWRAYPVVEGARADSGRFSMQVAPLIDDVHTKGTCKPH